jgi:predicted AAA+ superfamily ATPase
MVLDIPIIDENLPLDIVRRLANVQKKNSDILLDNISSNVELINIVHGISPMQKMAYGEVVEQDVIKTILGSQLKDKTFKNCLLFTGSAGTGKTSSARIFGNEINEFKGSLIELDAASNNSVDDVRRIIDESKYRALDAPYKVFILDEVHSLITQAWQALLKALEEPVPTSVYILCTTDPQKIPGTILSRVQRYNFEKITPKENIIYINFEDDRLYPLELKSLDDLLESYYELYPTKRDEKIYLFFDEINSPISNRYTKSFSTNLSKNL